MVPVAAQSLANVKEPGHLPRLPEQVMKTGRNVNLWFVEIGPIWFLGFQPRVLLLHHALIQLLTSGAGWRRACLGDSSLLAQACTEHSERVAVGLADRGQGLAQRRPELAGVV
jgi:hypothetical protein